MAEAGFALSACAPCKSSPWCSCHVQALAQVWECEGEGQRSKFFTILALGEGIDLQMPDVRSLCKYFKNKEQFLTSNAFWTISGKEKTEHHAFAIT